jgi:biopolymer transport protein ExbD
MSRAGRDFVKQHPKMAPGSDVVRDDSLMKHRSHLENLPVPGFQIAPMIDVVFVIMLFFMVMAGLQRKEGELGLRLPDGSLFPASLKMPDEELLLELTSDGSVMMNGERFDSPSSSKLPELRRALRRVQTAVSAQHSKVLATIDSEPDAGFQRVMDVLDALHVAGISHVTFQVGTAVP